MTTTPTTVLQLLLDYSEQTQQGHDLLKSSVWQMTKVRRKQVRGMLTMEENVLSAEQIREDIRPRMTVRDENPNDEDHEKDDDEEEDEPDLISDGEKKHKNDNITCTVLPVRFSATSTNHIPKWKVVDVVQERAANKENPSSSTTTSTSTNDLVTPQLLDSSSGLRQRKNKTDEAPPGHISSRTTTSMEMKADPVVNNSDDDEEDLFWQRDPLELFAGVRPSDLKLAQTHAKEALNSYIQAANLAALILGELQKRSG